MEVQVNVGISTWQHSWPSSIDDGVIHFCWPLTELPKSVRPLPFASQPCSSGLATGVQSWFSHDGFFHGGLNHGGFGLRSLDLWGIRSLRVEFPFLFILPSFDLSPIPSALSLEFSLTLPADQTSSCSKPPNVPFLPVPHCTVLL